MCRSNGRVRCTSPRLPIAGHVRGNPHLVDRTDAFLRDVLEYARKALQFVEGMTEEQFMVDERTQFAVLLAIEIVGGSVEIDSGIH